MIPYAKGKITRQAHVGIPEGMCEEEFGRGGFFGRYAHLYRSRPPVDWSRIEGNLRPRAFNLLKDKPKAGDFFTNRHSYLYNNDVNLQFLNLEKAMNFFFRNADGDELYFIHEGKGILDSDFGRLHYKTGDYLVIPRGTVYQLSPETLTQALIIETREEIRLPDKGMLGQHALFDPAVIKVPDPDEFHAAKKEEQEEYKLSIKRAGELTHVFYPFSPLNTMGWKGTLTIWQLNVDDIRPISCERYHLPPSAHTTFLSRNVVICSFLPRALEAGDPTALKVPFYHANIDYDEVLFYHSGEFFSRTGIDKGMLTLHPQGIHHGPQKKAVENSHSLTKTNEVAVMLDTRNPLYMSDQASQIEEVNYWKSWR